MRYGLFSDTHSSARAGLENVIDLDADFTSDDDQSWVDMFTSSRPMLRAPRQSVKFAPLSTKPLTTAPLTAPLATTRMPMARRKTTDSVSTRATDSFSRNHDGVLFGTALPHASQRSCIRLQNQNPGSYALPASPASVAMLQPGPAPDTTPGKSAAYARGDHYRELAERARLSMRRVSATGIANARETACSSYARPIRREVEETSRFLSTLSINPPTRTLGAVSSPSDYDPAVAGTLERVDQLRKDFERKLREEKEAERRKIEERARAEREKKRLAEEAAKKAVEDAKKAEEEKQAQARAKIEAAEQKKKAEKEAKEAAEAAAKEAAKEAAAKEAQLEKSKQVSPDALEWAARYRSMYRQLMDGLAVQVKNNKTAKAYCFKQRGLVTRSIGQLKDSMAYVNRIANTIAQVLREASEQQGEEAHQWMLNLVAKGLVKQAETEVSVAQHAAYPLAATAVLLMQQYPLLVDMVLIRLVKKCPYVIPQYIARTPSQSQEEYLRSIGYKEKEEGELESEGIYCERMAGMLALYAAILQTPQLANKPNPLPVSHAWAWLARMINMPPRSISPLLVQTFLSIAGTSMAAAYGKQFTKVMDVLSTAWIPSIADSSPSAIAAKSNIRGFVDEYFASGIINGCEGRVIKP